MPDVLREIRKVLGPEAILLSSKELPRRAGAWGRSGGVEVVAAVDQPDDFYDESVDVVSSNLTQISEEQLISLCSESEEEENPVLVGEAATYTPETLLRQTRATNDMEPVSPPPVSPAVEGVSVDSDFGDPTVAALYNDLVAGDVDATLARRLVSEAMAGLSRRKRRNREALINAVAQSLPGLSTDASGENDLPGKNVVAFIGPTGVGKTTSIAKLAAHLSLGRKKKVLLFSLDGYRIGAVEQLRTYAGLIGVPFRFVSHVSELSSLIAENSQRDYILIDTTGRGRKDMHLMENLSSFLSNSEHVERHLVMSASMKPSDMRRIHDQFEICRPDHLLFTKLDETTTPGPILNELARTKKKFSYYTDGQRVPDDLHVAARGQIMDLVLNGAMA